MPIPTEAYNLSTGDKWLLVIPFKQIDENFSVDNIALNLTNFSLPELTIGETEMSIMGKSFNLPTGVRNEDKNISFSYMLSSNWSQYQLLYKWFSMISNEDSKFDSSFPNTLLDITVFVLTEFKEPIFSIVFRGCWINRLGSIDFNYQSGEENIQHEFGINYATYEFQDLL
jgi:hypothetical protein